MIVKKFEAPSLEQALIQIKRELGPNALILSTERKKGAWFSKSAVEVTAAFERKTQAVDKTVVQPDESKLDEGFDERELIKIFPHRRKMSTPKEKASTERKQAINRYVEVDAETAEEKNTTTSKTAQLEKYESFFLQLGFSPESSREFARRLIYDYSKKDLDQPAFLRRARTKIVAGGMHTLGTEQVGTKPGWVAIGTPGAGKTTLLVKLALYLKGQKRSVQLVSCDGRKMAGRGELSGYARLIKVPFTASSIIETSRLQLIDCPSLSLHSDEECAELEKICLGRRSVLVLDASVRLQELLRTVEGARRFAPTALAFTRLDLVSNYGVIHDVLKASKIPLLGLSLSRSFTTPFKFFDPAELAAFLLNQA